MALNPFLVQAGVGLLGGLLGGRQGELSPEQKFQMGIARDMRAYGKSAPGSDPGERMALANNQAQLGELLNQQRQGLYSQMPANVTTAPMDMAQSIAANEMSQRMALNAQAMMDALQNRRQALMNAAGIAQGVGPRQQTNNLGQTLGGLAQSYAAYQEARQGQQNWQDMLAAIRGGQQQGATAGIAGTQGVAPPSMPSIPGSFMGQMNSALQLNKPSSTQPLAPPSGQLFNPALGMARSQQGNDIPMQPPMGAGYGNPTPNNNTMLNTPDLFSRLKSVNFGFAGLDQSGVR